MTEHWVCPICQCFRVEVSGEWSQRQRDEHLRAHTETPAQFVNRNELRWIRQENNRDAFFYRKQQERKGGKA